MTNVVQPQVVEDHHVPVWGRQLGLKVSGHVVVHLGEVGDEEGGGGVLSEEVAGEQFAPGIVTEHRDISPVTSPLSDERVLHQSVGVEVPDDVDEAGDGARHDRLQPGQGDGGRTGLGDDQLRSARLEQRGEIFYLELALTDCCVLYKVQPEGIDDHDDQSAHPTGPGWRETLRARGLAVSGLQREEACEKETVDSQISPRL